MKRVLFLGGGRLAARCLEALRSPEFASDLRVGAVVGSKELLARLGPDESEIRSLPDSERNEEGMIGLIHGTSIDTIISVQFRWILGERILECVNGAAFNLHNAPLPRFQGYHCIAHAISEGTRRYGSTMHEMVPEVDRGNIVAKTDYEISYRSTAEDLYLTSIDRCNEMFNEFLLRLVNGTLRGVPQKGYGRFYAKSELAGLRDVTEVSDSAARDRRIRACYFPPYEPAFIELDGARTYLVPESSWTQLTDGRLPASSELSEA